MSPSPDSPFSASVEFVADDRALRRVVARLRESLARDPRLALDTEFIRERTYAPVLEVVQIAADPADVIAVIDIPALQERGDLEPLGELLSDPNILKILHSGSQDMEILTLYFGGNVPTPVYDTQVAAAFAGWSAQTGYAGLVQSLLSVRLSKEEGFSDWSRRPLTASMLDYAANDVRYLHALHDRLSALLEKNGRTAWAEAQTAQIFTQAVQETPPDELWRRVGGRNTLDRKQLAVLRELAIWRDEEAQRRNKPRRTALKDDALVEIARRAPQTGADVLALRAVPVNLGERAAGEIAVRVRRGLAVPDSERPATESAPPLDDQGAALVELLTAVVRIRAIEENLPPSLLATSDDLRTLAGSRRRADALTTGALFTGWRGQLIGDSLRQILTGESAVAWDARRGRLSLVSSEPTTDK